ncbi:recombinase family protein [Shinella sp.]|uniref:recombinase family protein n=1 Tax=Shinella sp. TaxID=1870904 RepID=UPI0025851ED0|nr:recombinase family protein [Shinella sp.]MCW5710205.1 recombinase family protein [Shinella sp.]
MPVGGASNPSVAINSHRNRGTGILNNELYIGRLVFNRLEYRKNPATERRVSRPNSNDEHVVAEVPDLRIVSDQLWNEVKLRQGNYRSKR